MTRQLQIGGVPEHFNPPWKLAITDRAFDSIGVQVEFTEHPGGTGAMTAALRARELDAALMLTEGAVLDIVAGYAARLKRDADSAEPISRTYEFDLSDAGVWLADVRWSQDHEYPAEDIHRALAALHSQGVIPDAEFSAKGLWHAL